MPQLRQKSYGTVLADLRWIEAVEAARITGEHKNMRGTMGDMLHMYPLMLPRGGNLPRGMINSSIILVIRNARVFTLFAGPQVAAGCRKLLPKNKRYRFQGPGPTVCPICWLHRADCFVSLAVQL